jgi:hypothetical protein
MVHVNNIATLKRLQETGQRIAEINARLLEAAKTISELLATVDLSATGLFRYRVFEGYLQISSLEVDNWECIFSSPKFAICFSKDFATGLFDAWLHIAINLTNETECDLVEVNETTTKDSTSQAETC